MNKASHAWWQMLVAVTSGLIAFGLILVLLPGLTRQGFSWMIYGSPAHLDAFAANAVAYISLVHAVLGAVMVGWGSLMLWLTLGPLRRGRREAWTMFVAALLAWFIPDTAYSLLSGFWQNAVLNTVFALLFALPLIALKSAMRHGSD